MASYQIYQFDAVPLPLYNPESSHDVAVESTLRQSIGGLFDVAGSAQRAPGVLTTKVSGVYVGEETLLVTHNGTYIVDHDGDYIATALARGALRRQVDVLRGKIGVRGTLYRRRWDDTTVIEWKVARLLSIQEKGTRRQQALIAEIDLQFETAHAAWRAQTVTTETKTLGASALRYLYVQNGGNAPVNDAIITITATDTITSVAIAASAIGAALNWSGSIAAGKRLIIDCGAQTVLNNGADAYSGFSLGGGHSAQGWLPVPVESRTAVAITCDAAASVSIAHYNQFI